MGPAGPVNGPVNVWRFVVPLTGGMHQALHLLPVAVALDARGHHVQILTMDGETTGFSRRLLDAYAPNDVRLGELGPGRIERAVARVTRRNEPVKSLRLLEHRERFRHADALVVAERTTSLLRGLRLFDRPMIHVPHGAGDRAVGYEARIARYDFHIVAGAKDRARFIEAGLAAPERVAACGYIKFAGVARLRPCPARLFANDRPVIFYNPHFDPTLGSFDAVGPKLIEVFAGRSDLNFVVAPHIKLAERLLPATRAAVMGAAAANIIVDLGSTRSCDMSYTQAADIYLGDVSSQVYEFASRPRPAVFIDAAGTDWRDDPHFAMWRMGAVVPPDVPAIMAALDAAGVRQAEFAAVQATLVAEALGPDWRQAPERAADAVLAYMAGVDDGVALGQRSTTP